MSAPAVMRVAVLRGAGDVAIEERPAPRPGRGEVLVTVGSVGVCGSDTHYYDHGRIGRFVVESPLVLGHEASGVIAAVGDGVDPSRVGQRVSIEPGVPDLTCRMCLSGRYNLCPDMRFFATPPIDGAFAELVVVHEAFAHPVPDSISDDAAALLEPLSVAVWACRKARVTAGSRVLVTGAGAIGLVSVQTALAFGATEVAVSDVNPARLALARELGATAVIDARDAGPDSLPLATRRADRGAPVTRSPRSPGSPPSTWPAGRCSSAWAATSCRCRCPSCRSASSRSRGRSVTPTPGRRPSSWSPRAASTSTGW